MGLSASQQVIEVRLDNDLAGSLKDRIDAALAEQPDHRIVALSTVASGEFPMYVRAIIVIEYV
ncbi:MULTISPECIES: hypothetical protein [Bacteria]|jgi:hypothetical protein